MKHLLLVAACALATTGCLTEVTTSSRSYLPADQSGATSSRAPVAAAREVTRLFEVRGYALADEHAVTGGGYALKLTKSMRGIPADKDESYQAVGVRDLGSAFYVWVMPAGTGSTISMIGKPTLNGEEPCSADAPELACSSLSVADTFASTFMSGKAEADVVHGVLAELALEGFATGPLPASVPVVPRAASIALVPDSACLAQRHAAMTAAEQVSDLEMRAKLLQGAPECSPAVAEPATGASAPR